MKLYDHPESFNSLRARAAAFEAERDIEICTVDLFAGAHRQPAFHALNPFERVPVFEDGDFRMSESCAIAVHVARETALVPSDARTRAHLDQWQFFGAIHVTGAMTKVFRQRVVHRALGAPVDEAVVATGLAELDEVLPVLEGALARREWLLGELTIADLSVAAPLTGRRAAGVDLGSYPAIERWLARLAERPAWKRALSPCTMLGL